MEFRDFILSEVRLHILSEPPKKEPYLVVAFRGDAWLFDPEDLHTQRFDLRIAMDKILSAFPQQHFDVGFFKSPEKPINNSGVFTWVAQSIQDGFVGSYHPDEKLLAVKTNYGGFALSYYAPIIKKVCKALGATHFFFDGETYPVEKETDGVYYHGTAQGWVPSIMKYGLDPARKHSHWRIDEIKPYIYLTDRIEVAKSHANMAAHMTGRKPVVLKITHIDPAKLVPDYDMDRRSIDPHFYYHKYPAGGSEPRSSVDSFKTSKVTGMFGYKGRIPAKHIEILNY